ncbi:ABC transporter substrate-binding protein [Mycobacterium sp. CVI_P3]|uniref:ABC transporter substrate-binding protein n=1 Tax=Mycobacterium pinniadriaticum TaxID=2994102 RepID=A0ABT3SAY6_9MYCO|nr:ABC transporter substrate-binding protein [Mycobacterium pinniadriaticum]MCX2930262.1 ABC transporter substrate-binding protein [Mycobacterium pinniadriaticum]MCX2936676.1 ABC transporter substrate-binding protein [Mycobacterium pinniadriaticum]
MPGGEVLRVGAAFPDPPFNSAGSIPGSLRSCPPEDSGLDIDLMTAIAEQLGAEARFVRYEGRDFNGIFDALDSGDFDCVASGTTITGSRALKAAFCDPYLISGQALAVDTGRLPDVRSIDDLDGLTIGVQQGNTSQPIANRLLADGKVARIRVYDYGGIRGALRDLSTGRCDAFMKLGPVLSLLASAAPGVAVVQRGITTEKIAIAVPTSDTALLGRINVAQATLEEDGTLPAIRERWTGSPLVDQSGPQAGGPSG